MGEQAGYTYPENPPHLALYGPNKITDYLTPATTPFLSPPQLMDPTEGVDGLDDVQRGLLVANHNINVEATQGAWQKMKDFFSTFYYGIKDKVLKQDSLNQFYMDLYGHADGCLRELARSNAAKVFKPEVRQAVQKKTEDKEITGLLDGDVNLVDKLQESNKTNEVITKVMFPSLFTFETFLFPQNVLKTNKGKAGTTARKRKRENRDGGELPSMSLFLYFFHFSQTIDGIQDLGPDQDLAPALPDTSGTGAARLGVTPVLASQGLRRTLAPVAARTAAREPREARERRRAQVPFLSGLLPL